MKKVLSILVSIVLMTNVGMAYTSTVQVKGLGLIVTSDVGSVVEIIPKTNEVTGWVVKSGNTTVTDNKFTMPSENVVIEGTTKSGYLLTVEMPQFTRTENKEAGESVTVEAVTENEGYSFSSWTATGINLTASQKLSRTLTFTMPSNTVKLVANYGENLPSSYNVTVTSSPTAGGSVTGGGAKAPGETVTLTATTSSGYNFVGWEVLSGEVAISSANATSITFSMPLENVSVRALFNIPTISTTEITAGAYITYVSDKAKCTLTSDDGISVGETTIPDPQEATSWKVFKNNNGQLDIISSESVATVTLFGEVGYCNAVNTLNKLCESYVNSVYATSARSLGCSTDSQATISSLDGALLGTIEFPYHDTCYLNDKSQLDSVTALQCSDNVWLASRTASDDYEGITGRHFLMRIVRGNQQILEKNLYVWIANAPRSYTQSAGVRPIVSLKSNIKITGGDGTAENPYTISL